MSERGREYYQNYYQNIRRPKAVAFKAVASATCQVCGDDWAIAHAGWQEKIFVCGRCYSKLWEWERSESERKRELATLCQICQEKPAIGVDKSTQLRYCLSKDCIACLLEQYPVPTGAANPWDADEKLGHIFEYGAQFHEPPAVASLCGAKAPISPLAIDMLMPAALRRFGLCVACLQACPDPERLGDIRHSHFLYVVPTAQADAQADAPVEPLIPAR